LIKKTLTLITALLLTFVFAPEVNAATLDINPSDDIWVSSSHGLINYQDIAVLSGAYDPYSADKPPAYTYLKFNVSKLLDYRLERVSSAYLLLHSHFTYGRTDNINAFYVQNDTWDEDIHFNYADRPVYSNENYLSTGYWDGVNSYGSGIMRWDLNVQDINEFFDINDNLISFALDNSSETPLRFPYQVSYFSKDSPGAFGMLFKPALVIETTPVPEPTSILLGFLGLGSALSLRRKKYTNK